MKVSLLASAVDYAPHSVSETYRQVIQAAREACQAYLPIYRNRMKQSLAEMLDILDCQCHGE